jgi:hypothetical protein
MWLVVKALFSMLVPTQLKVELLLVPAVFSRWDLFPEPESCAEKHKEIPSLCVLYDVKDDVVEFVERTRWKEKGEEISERINNFISIHILIEYFLNFDDVTTLGCGSDNIQILRDHYQNTLLEHWSCK